MEKQHAVDGPAHLHRTDPQGPATMETKPLNILYVEDDRDLVLLVRERLRKAGFVVDAAYDGEEALAKYRARLV